jgi:quinol monooxygenase YgiN
MAYVVIAKWTANEGAEEAVLDAIRQLIPHSRAEPGSRVYQPCRDPENPREFVLFEVYDDEASYQAHLDSEHARRLVFETAIPLLASRERTFLTTIDG